MIRLFSFGGGVDCEMYMFSHFVYVNCICFAFCICELRMFLRVVYVTCICFCYSVTTVIICYLLYPLLRIYIHNWVYRYPQLRIRRYPQLGICYQRITTFCHMLPLLSTIGYIDIHNCGYISTILDMYIPNCG